MTWHMNRPLSCCGTRHGLVRCQPRYKRYPPMIAQPTEQAQKNRMFVVLPLCAFARLCCSSFMKKMFTGLFFSNDGKNNFGCRCFGGAVDFCCSRPWICWCWSCCSSTASFAKYNERAVDTATPVYMQTEHWSCSWFMLSLGFDEVARLWGRKWLGEDFR